MISEHKQLYLKYMFFYDKTCMTPWTHYVSGLFGNLEFGAAMTTKFSVKRNRTYCSLILVSRITNHKLLFVIFGFSFNKYSTAIYSIIVVFNTCRRELNMGNISILLIFSGCNVFCGSFSQKLMKSKASVVTYISWHVRGSCAPSQRKFY